MRPAKNCPRKPPSCEQSWFEQRTLVTYAGCSTVVTFRKECFGYLTASASNASGHTRHRLYTLNIAGLTFIPSAIFSVVIKIACSITGPEGGNKKTLRQGMHRICRHGIINRRETELNNGSLAMRRRSPLPKATQILVKSRSAGGVTQQFACSQQETTAQLK